VAVYFFVSSGIVKRYVDEDGTSGGSNKISKEDAGTGMIHLIATKQEAIAKLCERYHVKRLELFGSARSDEHFNERDSDLDFLVEFSPLKPGERADTYFGLLEALEALFQLPVDLVMPKAIKNPYFLEAIQNNRELLYAA